MSTQELLGVDAFIYGSLTADTALAAIVGARIFADFAPDKDPATGAEPIYPLVVFAMNSAGKDVRVVGGTRIMVTPLYLIKVVGERSGFAALQGAADRIEAVLALVRSPATVTFGGHTYNVRCAREQAIRYAEASKTGIRYNHLGGLYRFYVS